MRGRVCSSLDDHDGKAEKKGSRCWTWTLFFPFRVCKPFTDRVCMNLAPSPDRPANEHCLIKRFSFPTCLPLFSLLFFSSTLSLPSHNIQRTNTSQDDNTPLVLHNQHHHLLRRHNWSPSRPRHLCYNYSSNRSSRNQPSNLAGQHRRWSRRILDTGRATDLEPRGRRRMGADCDPSPWGGSRS